MTDSFHCASLSPLYLEHAGIALATVRAGGIGLLDVELCPPTSIPRAQKNLQHLLSAVPAGPEKIQLGLRLAARQLTPYASLLDTLDGRPHAVVLCDWSFEVLAELLVKLERPNREIWLEIGAGSETAVDNNLSFTGWLARGSECGGRSGHESAFILCQRLAQQSRPFMICGGMGPRTAAACRVAGAAGVVLDDVLLLLRESPLPHEWQALLARINLSDTRAIGNPSFRVIDRPDFPAARHFISRVEAAAAELGNQPPAAQIQAIIDEWVGWDDPDQRAWPVGQTAGRASEFAARYKTVGKTIQAVMEVSQQHIQLADEHPPLAPTAALAQSHGTRYPIVQGPMTRVSDRAEFAAAVADSGALPLLALAQMRRPEIERLLNEVEHTLNGRPWGIGILGFLPPQMRQEQLSIIDEVKPPFALIAGGRPDQAAPLEAQGIATYLHAPTPQLLQMFLSQGARRFVFEGAECGGHVGPLNGFVLWETMIDRLLEELPAADFEDTHILFAGGIHDAYSAAMVAAMAAPLAARGVRVGVLMGTAYLFTEEAVASGAIVNGMQQQAIACNDTVTLQTGPGHAIRCAPTPFTLKFAQVRSELQLEGRSPVEVGQTLENMIVGRLRVASKGLERQTDRLQSIDDRRQQAEGMYMMGELAALRTAATNCADLHEQVSIASTELIKTAAGQLVERRKTPEMAPAQVAIVGVGCVLPGAQDQETFWRNLIDPLDTIREIPPERWDWRLYYDPDPAAPDKITSKWGGFIDPLPFDPLHFGIPPKSLSSISMPQLLALEVTRRALQDAGYGDRIADDELRQRTAVFFGAGNTGDIEQFYMTRSALPLVEKGTDADARRRLPTWTEESYPGILVNVIAGRVANRFDFGGPNLTLDAACASSLAALDMAVRELESGRSDLVLAGGIECEQTPQAYMAFSKTQALSPLGRARVFDENGDGIVISEGAVILVLKRLADAERDGDRIYAVIRSVAGSSDGKGLGLTAPKPAGQRRAFDRAHAIAGSDPAQLQMYEAHATGTAVGDRAELEMITGALRAADAQPHHCAVGSAKSLLGHTRATAGMVGLLKAALALRHQTLPPHAGVQVPLALFQESDVPVYLLDQPRPWINRNKMTSSRRAGISAFGFGGTNFHTVIEEYRVDAAGAAPLGAADWPAELLVLQAKDQIELQEALISLETAAAFLSDGERDHPYRLRDLAYTCAALLQDDALLCLAIVATDAADLRQKIAAIRESLQHETPLPAGVFMGSRAAAEEPDEIAFLFPGQGSQYPGMGGELALYFGEMRDALAAADTLLPNYPNGLSRMILPAAAFSEEEHSAQKTMLAQTQIAQPAIAAVSCGMLDLAQRLGLQAARTAGHSFGEFVALYAAGVLDRSSLLRLAQERGHILAELGPDSGTMAVALLSEAELTTYLTSFPEVKIANINAPSQCALSGAETEIELLAEKLQADGHIVRPLPVSAAFHSPLMQPASTPFAAFLNESLVIRPPQIPVHANLDGLPYPQDPAAIRDRWVAHLENQVNFVAQIEQMYAAGTRTFVELGPGRVLTGLVGHILGDRSHLALAADGDLGEWLKTLGQLFAAGTPLKIKALYGDRDVHWLDMDHLPESKDNKARWLLDGGRIWPADSATSTFGELPLLNQESAMIPVRNGQPTTPTPSPRTLAGTEFTQSTIPVSSVDSDTITAVYHEYQETMRHFLSQQERLMMQVLSHAAGEGKTQGPTAPLQRSAAQTDRVSQQREKQILAPPPAAVEKPVEITLDHQSITRQLIKIVSERTGYPAELLDPDQDLEAELGIDSIKRIEILGRLPEVFPGDLAQQIQSQLDRLTTLKSLNGLAEALLSSLPAAAQRMQTTQIEVTTAVSDRLPENIHGQQDSSSCPRYVMHGNVQALLHVPDDQLAGLFIVTEDSLGISEQVINALKQRGARAFLIRRSDLMDQELLERRVMPLLYIHGPLQGIVHLAALGLERESDNLADWRQATTVAAKGLFRLLQLCVPGFENSTQPLSVLAVSRLGGNWGRDGNIADSPAAGAEHGILRTLESEFPQILSKAVDFEPALSPQAMAELIVDELSTADGGYEIGYINGHRLQFATKRAPFTARTASQQWRPQSGWVVLVTGGARGITAEICRELAQPDVQFLIVGRSPEPLAEDPLFDLDVHSLRQHLIAKMGNEVERPTPAEIEFEVQRIQKENERRQNILALQQSGAAVEYHAVDVRSEAAFGGLIDEIYERHGRIDAVIHGAGIIEDKRLQDKTYASFARVFDTKADSTFILSRRLRPEGLKWAVFFSSVAGRFGNQGQIDYAAANEVVNRLACQMDTLWSDTRVVSINWGPWRGAGMANAGIQRLFAAKGITPVEPQDGRRFFVDELTYGRKGEVEVIAGDGPWKADSDQRLNAALEIGALFLQIRALAEQS